MKAMIFAAGLGTRLRPLTDNVPKALIEINGRTLLEICINRLKEIGINDIVVNVHHHANQIIKYLERNNNFGINIKFSDETDLLLDTGGGLKKATHLLIGNEPILLHNVDIISNINLSQLISYHNNNNSLSTLAVMNRLSNRSFLINEKGILCGWQNTTTGEKIIVRDHDKLLQPVGYCGIAVIQPKFLKKITLL